ncbi:MAG: ion transporter [Thermoanaerobaculia bacterium]
MRERHRLLAHISGWLELPMIFLAFVWLILLIVEWVSGLTPFMQQLGTVIWALFVADFLLRFTIAPRKIRFLKRQWLTAISLAVPALRIFRLIRIIRVAAFLGELNLVTLVGTMNRSMAAVRRTFRRRGFGYVIALTAVVTFAGAAGIYAFERGAGNAFDSYGTALWWTAMLMTTMGTGHWPVSAEGRILTLGLSIYAFAVFGYVTATIASYFIDDSDRTNETTAEEIRSLREEIARLRSQIETPQRTP